MEIINKSARILRLDISRFRGIRQLTWIPDPNINVIIGGGDTGKSTVLEAIALLFNPTNSSVISEYDYWLREYENEFLIEAVLELPDSIDTSKGELIWPWEWSGKDAIVGSVDKEISSLPAVYRFRVRGTAELELIWEIVQPNDTLNHFSVGLRREIGVVSLSSEEKNDRDLRLVYGSSLDKLIGDSSLRGRIGKKLAGVDVQSQLDANGQENLKELNDLLKCEGLPHNLSLGLTSSKGISIGSLIGLLAKKNNIAIPLANWGSGTRRMATLEIVSLSESESHIILIDEVERGLESYRQRKLMKMLQEKEAQCFLTTHSPITISSLSRGKLWYMDSEEHICELENNNVQRHFEVDPEMFFAKFPVVAEGATEAGFIAYLLEKYFESSHLDFGVRVCDARGNDTALNLLEALSKTKMTIFGLVDDEGRFEGKWKAIKSKLKDRLLQWESGCLEENVISKMNDQQLETLLFDSEGVMETQRLRTLVDRVGINENSLTALKDSGVDLRQLIIAAATGDKSGAPDGKDKDWSSHGRRWFKSFEGGRELAIKVDKLELMQSFNSTLLPLINSILVAAEQDQLETL